MTCVKERRPVCLAFRVLRTPAPTQAYQPWDHTYRPYPHCTPGFETTLHLVHPRPRILHGILRAFRVQHEDVRRVCAPMPQQPWSDEVWYVETQRTLYLMFIENYGAHYRRACFAPVR